MVGRSRCCVAVRSLLGKSYGSLSPLLVNPHTDGGFSVRNVRIRHGPILAVERERPCNETSPGMCAAAESSRAASLAAARAKYVRMPSAPARLKARRLSSIVRFPIEPALFVLPHKHRVFTADLIRKRGHAERVLDAANDIEIRHSGFHHHHVSPFGNIERHFADGLVGICRVHLVGALVAASQV